VAEEQPTLMRVAAERVGQLRAGRVLAFMVSWQLARRSLRDEWPDRLSDQVRAHATWWRESERSAWRDLQRFRDCFPEEESPSRLMDAAEAASWDARGGVQGLGALPLPA
jgi:hypothetical protein